MKLIRKNPAEKSADSSVDSPLHRLPGSEMPSTGEPF